jgi:hypothetical protein
VSDGTAICRLGSVIIQAFDDCTTIFSCFKLVDNFEGLVDREIILADIERKRTDLLKAFQRDLQEVQDIFIRDKDEPPVFDNMPPRAGAVAWCRGMIERVDEPMSRMKLMTNSILDTEEGKEVIRMYNSLVSSLQVRACSCGCVCACVLFCRCVLACVRACLRGRESVCVREIEGGGRERRGRTRMRE